MLKHIKNLLLDKAIYVAFTITISIAILSFIKVPSEGLYVSSSDKVSHSIAYFFLTLSWLYTILKKDHFYSWVKYIIAGCFIYGTVIEVIQGAVTTYRTASYLDMVANSVGILLAILAFHIFEKKIRLI